VPYPIPFQTTPQIRHYRDTLAITHRNEMANWRGWNVRGARLLRYLDQPAPPAS
jgi:hypothetical protein